MGGFGMNSANDVWKHVLEILSGKLTATAIDTWFEGTTAVDLTDSRLVVYCPSDLKKEVLESRFLPILKEALTELFSGELDLLILGEGELDSFLNSKEPTSEAVIPSNNSLTFERFIIGSNNKFAHAAAKAVADQLATAYNPLFIYGDAGLGKTHLLYAIYHAVRHRLPDIQIVYIKGDEFANELIHAIQTNTNTEFRMKYRSADLLLVDDIQFISGKVQTQEEFFHTFNSLYESGCQIVLTSDRPPMEIMRLDDRLRSRFEWGLLADIQPPDYETRMAIVKKKSQQLGLTLSQEQIAFIAENVTSNIRQLEGAVKTLTAHRDLLDANINLSSVSRVLKEILKQNNEYTPTPEIIIQETANFYALTSADLQGRGRTRGTALARQVSMYLIRKITNLSLIDIGKEYEGKNGRGMDHSSVLSSIRKIEDLVKRTPDLADTIRDITANINARQ